jgi:hypothetical protein
MAEPPGRAVATPCTPTSVVIISKDEPALEHTLVALRDVARDPRHEVLVVDASRGRLAGLQRRFPDVGWFDHLPPAGVRISIPHQRNAGVHASRGEVVVFVDAGCRPDPDWLTQLVEAIEGGEAVVCGAASSGPAADGRGNGDVLYVDECPTINLAFRRDVADTVGPFDERFAYGSDVDWTWRVGEAGFRIRYLPAARVEHDWGTGRRRLVRSHRYGVARARLYAKHRGRLTAVVHRDPIAVAYPLYLLLLPLTAWFPSYPLLIALPLWRNRRQHPFATVADHLAYGAGVLTELGRSLRPRRPG